MATLQVQDELDTFYLGPKISTEPSPRPSDSLHSVGNYVTLESLTKDHVPSLWRNLDTPNNDVLSYLPMLRFDNVGSFWEGLMSLRDDRGLVFYAIKADPERLSPSARATSPGQSVHSEAMGIVAFLDIEPENRALEVGAVVYSPALQRTAAATEAQYLLLRHAFGEDNAALSPPYRRVVWKCNKRNAASRRSAERLDFVYEGTFRKHKIWAGRSRDSEWFSLLDDEWADFAKAGLELWLDKENFDADGRQIMKLEDCRKRFKVEE